MKTVDWQAGPRSARQALPSVSALIFVARQAKKVPQPRKATPKSSPVEALSPASVFPFFPGRDLVHHIRVLIN